MGGAKILLQEVKISALQLAIFTQSQFDERVEGEAHHILKAYHVRQIGFKLQNVSMCLSGLTKSCFLHHKIYRQLSSIQLYDMPLPKMLLFNQISQQHFMAQNSIE